MTRVRFTVGGLGLALLWVAGSVQADDEKPQRPSTTRQRPGQDRQRPGIGGFSLRPAPLLSKEEQEKLKLTDDQKPKVEKVVSAFDKEQKAATDKVREAMQKAREGGDADGFRDILQKAREVMQGNEKARTDAEAKLKAILTDEQKKTFDEIKKDRPAGPAFPGGRGTGGGGFPPGGFAPFGRLTPGQILPSAIQDRLELSKEQKEQLDKLQKEVDEKLQKILNADQKKKLDELKNRRPGGGRGGDGGPGGRPGGRGERPRRPAAP
jgi:Spy/CpxP family protein refolding chaperone